MAIFQQYLQLQLNYKIFPLDTQSELSIWPQLLFIVTA